MATSQFEQLFELAEAATVETERARQLLLAAAKRRQEAFFALYVEGLSLRAIPSRLECALAIVQAQVEKAKRRRPERMHSSLWVSYEMHLALGLKRAVDSERIRSIDRKNLDRMKQKSRSGRAERWLQRWDELLELPDDELAEAMLVNDEFTADIRQVTPFAGALDDGERLAAIRKARYLKLARS